MRTIGLIGGMSWVSSAEYYRIINESVEEELGGLHSAKCIMFSVDFSEMERLQREGRWAEAADLLADVAKKLEGAGADLILMCTNTMHKVAGEVQASVKVPLLHIADATAEKITSTGLKRVGLLGTRFTMEQDFYKGRLTDEFGIEVVVPDEAERELVHDVIYNELCSGKIVEESREKLKGVIEGLVRSGAQGIVLGCTELPLLIRQEDCRVPIFDTTVIHAKAAVNYALRG